MSVYTDQSSNVRTEWSGIEVEGRYKGLPTRFLTTLKENYEECLRCVSEPHIFLCPTVAQDCDPFLIEKFIHAAYKLRKVVTVAVRPTDGAKLRPFVKVIAHIMIDIDLHGFEWLKPSDSIKVETNFYTTLTATVETMVATTPHDYANDPH